MSSGAERKNDWVSEGLGEMEKGTAGSREGGRMENRWGSEGNVGGKVEVGLVGKGKEDEEGLVHGERKT